MALGGSPVLLAVKNPLARLRFKRRVEIEKREKYYFSVGKGDSLCAEPGF